MANQNLVVWRIRHALAISQQELAQLIGVSVQTISAVENCKRQLSEKAKRRLLSRFDLLPEQHSLLEQKDVLDFHTTYVAHTAQGKLNSHYVLDVFAAQVRARQLFFRRKLRSIK